MTRSDSSSWLLFWLVLLAVLVAVRSMPVIGLRARAQRAFRRALPLDAPIGTERLVIRWPTSGDVAALAHVLDDSMLEANGWTRSTRRATLSALTRGGRAAQIGPRLLVCGAPGGPHADEVLGTVMLTKVDATASRCELGWSMAPGARRLGFGKEAVAATIDAIHRAGIEVVRVGTAADNVAVQRTMEGLGAELVDRGQHRLPNRSLVDSLWYEHRA